MWMCKSSDIWEGGRFSVTHFSQSRVSPLVCGNMTLWGVVISLMLHHKVTHLHWEIGTFHMGGSLLVVADVNLKHLILHSAEKHRPVRCNAMQYHTPKINTTQNRTDWFLLKCFWVSTFTCTYAVFDCTQDVMFPRNIIRLVNNFFVYMHIKKYPGFMQVCLNSLKA